MLLNSNHLQAFIQNIITKRQHNRICTTVWILITSVLHSVQSYLFMFETSFHSVAQAVFELAALPWSAQCWDCRWVPPPPPAFQADIEKGKKESKATNFGPRPLLARSNTSLPVQVQQPVSPAHTVRWMEIWVPRLLSGLVNVSLQSLVCLFPVDRCGHVTLCSHKTLLSPFLLRLFISENGICMFAFLHTLWASEKHRLFTSLIPAAGTLQP